MPMLIAEVTETMDFSALITALQGVVTPAQLIAILASVVGVGAGFVLMWFGVRKISSMFQTALFKGRLRA